MSITEEVMSNMVFWLDAISLGPFNSLIFALVIIACCTRFITGREFQSSIASRTSPKTPATAPYIAPYLGHYITFCYTDALRWIQRLRHRVPYDLFAAHIWGRDFYILSDQGLIQRIFDDHATDLSFTPIRWYLLVNVFGASRRHHEAFLAADEDAHDCFKNLQTGSELAGLMQDLVSKIQDETPGLVSCSRSVVDENPWERFASPVIIPGNEKTDGQPQAVEVDMFALVRNFVGHITTSTLAGHNFLDVRPNFPDNLWKLERKWQSMLLAFPRWLPMPGLPMAYIARRDLCNTMTTFHKALDDSTAGKTLEPDWHDLDDVSTFLKERGATWRTHKTPTSLKASADLSVLWAANVKPGYLVFWMLFHIFSTPGLVADIRHQISPYIVATQPPDTFKKPEPPRLNAKDIEGLVHSCPLLESCFYECLRLYSKHLAIRKVTNRVRVTGTTSSNAGQPTDQDYTMGSGTYLVGPLSLQSHDEHRAFDTPELFIPDRFLSMGQDGKQRCEKSSLRAWGIGEAACPGRYFAEKQVLVFVAAIVSLWDMKSAGENGWQISNLALQSVIAGPRAEIRVLVQPRTLLSR